MYMKTTSQYLTVLLLGMAFAIVSCSGDESESGEKNSGGKKDRKISVRVQEIIPSDFVESIQLSGVVKAIDDIMLSAEEGGVLKEWKLEKGAYVRKGELIAQLKDDILKPSYDAAQAQYNTAELNYQKQKTVYEEKAVSELQIKSAEYARDAAKAQADLMRARWDHTQLRSPVDGILDDRLIDTGEMAVPGMPVARIVRIGTVKILINVPEAYAGIVARGTNVRFSVSAFPGKSFSGKISFVGSAVSPDNRTFPVELTVANSRHELKPEMIVRASVEQSVGRKTILLPEHVVQQVDQNRRVVYVVTDGKAEQRIVELGGRDRNRVEIMNGLKAGEHVVVAGYEELIEGTPVVIAGEKGS